MTIDELVNKYYENLNWLNVVMFLKQALFVSPKNYPYQVSVN